MLKLSLFLILMFSITPGFSQNPNETEGLKRVRYKDKMIEQNPHFDQSAHLSKEQINEVKQNIEIIRKKQAESQKILDELDQEN